MMKQPGLMRRRYALSMVIVLAVTLAVTSGLAIWLLKDPRKTLDVRTAFGADTYLAARQSDVVDSTRTTCPAIPRCVQSAESRDIRIIRFDSKTAARAYGVELAPYAYNSDWFVIRFLHPETMTSKEYQYVESAVDGVASSSPD